MVTDVTDPLFLAVRHIVLGLSAFMVGVMIFLAVLNIRASTRGKQWQIYYALARLGTAVSILLVAEAVYDLPGLKPEARSWLYILGLFVACIGYVGIIVHHAKSPDAT